MGEPIIQNNVILHPDLSSISDLYSIIFDPCLLPTEHVSPASYPPAKTHENEDGRHSTVEDICDFIVEYIRSDVIVCFVI